MPYDVAFKIVTVSGPVMLPAGAYCFAKGMRAPWPGTARRSRSPRSACSCRSAPTGTSTAATSRAPWRGSTPSRSRSALSLFALGALAYTLDTGKRRVAAGAAHRARVMSHVVVAIFIGVAALAPLAGALAPPHVADRGRGRHGRRAAHRGVDRAPPRPTGVHAEHALREGLLRRAARSSSRTGCSCRTR